MASLSTANADASHSLLDINSTSPLGSPTLGNQNSATFAASTQQDNDNDNDNEAANTSYDDVNAPASPGLPGTGASSAFTYTPNPNTEDNDKLGGPLHPGMMLHDDVEYGGGGAHRGLPSSKRSALFDGKRKWYWGVGAAILAVVIVGATVGGIKGAQKSSSSSSSGSGILANDASTGNTPNNVGKTSNYQGPGSPGIATQFGTNGSVITMENGQTFTYVNNFGGYYVDTPFDDSARAQSYTPALNESWDYTNMK
jgi:glucan 1,3-beta-glucosidase